MQNIEAFKQQFAQAHDRWEKSEPDWEERYAHWLRVNFKMCVEDLDCAPRRPISNALINKAMKKLYAKHVVDGVNRKAVLMRALNERAR